MASSDTQHTADFTIFGVLSRPSKKAPMQEQLPCPESKPPVNVYKFYVYSRLCWIVAGILGFWSVASLLNFLSDSTEEYSSSSSSSPPLLSDHPPTPIFSSMPHPEVVQYPSTDSLQSAKGLPASDLSDDACDGKHVYMHSLPPMFNQDIISDCEQNSRKWIDVCSATANGGLGPILEDEEGLFTHPQNGIHSWYNTEQFILDVLFHTRMKKYRCLTSNSLKADLIYVPFYAGLDLTRYLWDANVSIRDHLPNALAGWLTERPEWKAMDGRDHFLVTGKMSWDFRRPMDEESGWGNNLLELPALKNVSVLLIEKDTNRASHVEHAIPYPTHFHPHKDSEVNEWQDSMRAKERVNLVAFAGANRPADSLGRSSIWAELMEQCRSSEFCKLLDCNEDESGCNSPSAIMKLFQESVFCLQPIGHLYTRRSVFDSILCGCIPVLFHAHTVYTQYNWHLPQNFSSYSVFIPEEYIRAKLPVIEQYLRRFPALQVEEMREKVISLIPSLIYAHPDHQLEKVKDAFDVAMDALLLKVRASRRETSF
ncbi:hypothetical protein GOP47_0026171 [Adiantum capillus-veneris]|uniref:Exostosin GT47 domain-containing protein n=1 Tax=Adiantum capillus-veneris TaxID=13818 RepID=A0A9D4U1Y8_ADICA|nr:hypothetical protein GOP47_0026171 [Adiantum capillus-veneris]